jgi:copper chaperone
MMTEKTLSVEGMSCGHCKAAVEGELNKLSGVESSLADIERGTVEVSYDEGTVTTEDLKGAIEEAGYTVAA